jgi:drug/metabolite transporter (DMT)-like permease
MNTPPHNPHRGRLTLALAITVVLWSSAFAAIKSAGQDYGAGELALLRFSVAAVVLAIAGICKRSRLPRGAEIFWCFITGLIGVAIYHPFLNYGEHKVSAGAASLLINSAPVWTAILAPLFLNEKITLQKAAGIAVSFVGIALLVVGKDGHFTLEPAALFIIGSAICHSLFVIVQKKYLSKLSALDFTLWTAVFGVLILLPVFGISTWQELHKAHLRATLEVVYLGIFPATIAYIAFAYAAARMPASQVMTFMYLVPALAMIISWAYLKEVPTALSLLGGALAIAGVAIVNTAKRDMTTPAPVIEEG